MGRDTSPEFGRPVRSLFKDEGEKAQLEARNGLLQFDKLVELYRASHGALNITPETLLSLNHAAIQGIYGCAGTFRTEFVGIQGSKHVPPNWKLIPELVSEMSEYANSRHGDDGGAIHVAAYLLWRVNWIHPFMGGNGRTARAVSYLALSVCLNLELPGTNTLVDQLIQSNDAYFAALEAADKAWTEDRIGVGKMEDLISELLIRQLESGT